MAGIPPKYKPIAVETNSPAGFAPLKEVKFSELKGTMSPSPIIPEGHDVGNRKFPFGPVFQTKALAIILRLPTVMQDYCDDFKAGYFEDAVHQNLFRLIQKYYKVYKVTPTEVALLELIREDARQLGHNEDFVAKLASLASEIATQTDLSDAKYIQDRMVDFIKYRRAVEVTFKMVESLEKMELSGSEDFTQVLPLIRELNAIGNKGGLGYSFYDNVSSLPEQLRDSDIYSAAAKVPTGFKTIDHVLDGGLGAGEIGFIVAGAGIGKSTLLLNVAVAAQQAGVNVLVVTMELKESDFALRCAQRLAGVTKEHVLYKSERYLDRLPYVQSLGEKARIVFKYYPPGRATVDTIRSYFSQLLVQEGNDGRWLVIIDYLEKLKLSDDRRNNREDWALIGDAVNELIAFGVEFSVPVFSASQVTRSGYAKVARSAGTKHTDKDDIGSSWKKVEHADLILSFDQSEIEKAAGIARVRALKVRRGKDGMSFKVRDDRPIMNFVEIDDFGNDINAYCPRRDVDDLVTLRPAWDNLTPYPDETMEGLIRPPVIDIELYRKDQISSIAREETRVELSDVQSAQDVRIADMIKAGSASMASLLTNKFARTTE